MLEDDNTRYLALQSRDIRFDGQFLVAVLTTGIYCRPICRVKLPLRKNCRFFLTPAEAEHHGFRPCLRCRPELAPRQYHSHPSSRVINQALHLIEHEKVSSVLHLAQTLGLSERHLRRLFARSLGTTPMQCFKTQRLLNAKMLLTDTGISIDRIALYSGFGSVSQFYQHFKSHYKLTPSQLRTKGLCMNQKLTFTLSFKRPYDWASIQDYLAFRSLNYLESVHNGVYRRAIYVDDAKKNKRYEGWLAVRMSPDKSALYVELSDSLQAVVPVVLARLRDWFDLNTDPEPITKQLGGLAEDAPGLRIPGAWDGFEVAVRAVLGQQVTVKTACKLAGRVVELSQCRVTTPWQEVLYRFPSPAEFLTLSDESLGEAGIIRSRIQALKTIANAIETGELDLSRATDYEKNQSYLLSIKGIGPWTANYIGMRAQRWPDAFLAADSGVKKALNLTNTKQIEAIAEVWRPWRSYAVMHLWRKNK